MKKYVERMEFIQANVLRDLSNLYLDYIERVETEENGKVFAGDLKITPNPLSKTVKTGKGDLHDHDMYIYTLTVVKRIMVDKPEEEGEIIKEVNPTKLKPKLHKQKIKPDKDLWCDCPKCGKKWKYSHFFRCRPPCGNDEPPEEVKEQYWNIWELVDEI